MAKLVVHSDGTNANLSSFWDRRVTDEVMDPLLKHLNIEFLDLGRAKISEEKFARRAQLSNLRHLDIGHKNCRDEWLAHIEGLFLTIVISDFLNWVEE